MPYAAVVSDVVAANRVRDHDHFGIVADPHIVGPAVSSLGKTKQTDPAGGLGARSAWGR